MSVSGHRAPGKPPAHDPEVCGLDGDGISPTCPGCIAAAKTLAGADGAIDPTQIVGIGGERLVGDSWEPPEDGAPPDEPPGDAASPEDAPHLTDRGNAIRFRREHGHDLRHCHPWRKWLCWDGRRWRIDDVGAVNLRAKRLIAGMFRAAVRQVQEIHKQLEEQADDCDEA